MSFASQRSANHRHSDALHESYAAGIRDRVDDRFLFPSAKYPALADVRSVLPAVVAGAVRVAVNEAGCAMRVQQ